MFKVLDFLKKGTSGCQMFPKKPLKESFCFGWENRPSQALGTSENCRLVEPKFLLLRSLRWRGTSSECGGPN